MQSSEFETCLILGPSAERYKGGIAQFTSHLAEKLSKVCDLHFYSWSRQYPSFLSKRDFVDKVSETKVSTIEANFLLDFLNGFSWFKFLFVLRKIKPKTVFITWIHPVHAPIYYLFGLFIKLFTKSKLVFICHNVLPHESFFCSKFLSHRGLSFADALVVHSGSDKDIALSLFGKKKILQLFLPLHNFFVGPKALQPSESRYLLFFGHIREYKGVDVLLKAMPLVLEKYPELKLRVVGEIFDSKKIKDQLCELRDGLGLVENVEFDFRYVPNEEVSEVFSGAKLAVFPYRRATQSGPLTVAYSYSVPVVATSVGGLPDVVEDGVSGYLVESESPEALAQGILRFFEQPITEQSVADYAKRLSWERYIEELLRL